MQYYYNFVPSTKKGLSLILYKYSKNPHLFCTKRYKNTNILYT